MFWIDPLVNTEIVLNLSSDQGNYPESTLLLFILSNTTQCTIEQLIQTIQNDSFIILSNYTPPITRISPPPRNLNTNAQCKDQKCLTLRRKQFMIGKYNIYI